MSAIPTIPGAFGVESHGPTDPVWRGLSTRATLAGIGVLAVLFAVASPSFLPPKYFYDANFIQLITTNSTISPPDSFFQSTANVYESLGLSGHQALTAIISMVAFIIVTLAAVNGSLATDMGAGTLAVAVASMVLAALYLAPYSKETMTLVLVGFVVVASRSQYALILIVVGAGVYALVFRSYWALVGVSYVLCLVLTGNSRKGWKTVAAMCLGSILLFAVAIAIQEGNSLDSHRVIVNADRSTSDDAVTLIKPFISPGSNVSGVVNTVITFVFLVVPIPLVLLVSPQYLVTAVFLVFVWWRVAKSFPLITAEHGGPPRRTEARVAHAARHQFCLLLAFWLTQATYVPDYGSSLKHLTPMFPLIVGILAASDVLGRRRDEEEPVLPQHAA